MRASDKTLLNQLNLGIMVLDQDLNIIFTNNWLNIRFKLFEMDQILNSNRKETNRLKESILNATNEGQSSFLTSRLCPNPLPLFFGGHQLSYNMTISPYELESGKNSYALIQFHDTTQIVEREKYLEDKQRIIDERREDRFFKERLHSLGDITTSMAHEINNPLAVLEMNNRVLEKYLTKNNIMDPKLKELINNTDQSVYKISNLIKNVRELSVDYRTEFENINLGELLNTSLKLFTKKIEEEKIDVRINKSSSLFSTSYYGSKTLIGQMFLNLTANAIYAQSKLVDRWIDIDAIKLDDDIIIRFSDAGDGIPEKIRKSIFLPFYTTKDIGEGTGIGLSTVKKIVDAHGGEVKIDEDAKNTTFLVRLPVNQIQNKAS